MYKRLKDNRKILMLLHELIEYVPDQRFGQILVNYVFPSGCTDPFFYEGEEFITQLENSLEEIRQYLSTNE